MPNLDIQTPEIPGWVTAAPPDNSYSLTMFINNDYSDDDFNFDLTRDEFVALRDHLAEIRGFAVVLENS
jgi:hypothetical protein